MPYKGTSKFFVTPVVNKKKANKNWSGTDPEKAARETKIKYNLDHLERNIDKLEI